MKTLLFQKRKEDTMAYSEEQNQRHPEDLAQAPYVKVSRDKGEPVRRLLFELKLLATNLRIMCDGQHLLIPLVKLPSNNDSDYLKKQVGSLEFGMGEFQVEQKALTILDMLEEKIPPHILASLPKSLDIVGHVAIVEITSELEPFKSEIGRAILCVNKNVLTVLAKASPIDTQYRIRDFEVLAGEDRTETLHSEYGCRFLLDLRRVYFSPRLGFEHDRVSKLVDEGETVVDMFCGIGPFSILIAKRRSLVRIYAIDINPDAIRYLKENIRLNKVEEKVTPLLGDCRDIVREKLKGVAHRVIMNLPAQSLEFIDLACEAIRPAGGITHLYTFSDEEPPFEKLKETLRKLILSAGRSAKEIEARIVKDVAPYKRQVVLDVSLT